MVIAIITKSRIVRRNLNWETTLTSSGFKQPTLNFVQKFHSGATWWKSPHQFSCFWSKLPFSPSLPFLVDRATPYEQRVEQDEGICFQACLAFFTIQSVFFYKYLKYKVQSWTNYLLSFSTNTLSKNTLSKVHFQKYMFKKYIFENSFLKKTFPKVQFKKYTFIF